MNLPMQGTLGRCPQAWEQQSPCATTSEAHLPSSSFSAAREAAAVRSPRTTRKSSPCLRQLEKVAVDSRTMRVGRGAEKEFRGQDRGVCSQSWSPVSTDQLGIVYLCYIVHIH